MSFLEKKNVKTIYVFFASEKCNVENNLETVSSNDLSDEYTVAPCGYQSIQI